MAFSRVVKIGDGSSTQFSVNFALDYISQDHITARVGTEVDGLGAPVYRAITFLSTNLLQIAGPPAGIGVAVLFERTVPKNDLIINYSNGDVLDEENLDTSQKQTLMAVQEVIDGRFSTLTQNLDLGGFKVINSGAPTASGDLTNKEYVDNIVGDLAGLSTEIAQVAAIADELVTVAGIDDDVSAVADVAAAVAIVANSAPIITGTASALFMSESVFTGDGATTTWTLGTAPIAAANVDVFVDGEILTLSQYSVAGSVLTITPAVADTVQIIARTRVFMSANDMIAIRDQASGVLDEFNQIYLGEWTALPESGDTGFAIQNGALVSLSGSIEPANDGMYVRRVGAWTRVGGLINQKYSAFATLGQTVITVPGGYTVSTVKVFRNGSLQKVGPDPIAGDTGNDCTADDGLTVVWPASVLLANDWVFVTSEKDFAVANISAADITIAPTGGVAATDVQAAIAELDAEKVGFDSPVFTGNPRAPTPSLGDDDTSIATTAFVQAAITDAGASPATTLLSAVTGDIVRPYIDFALPAGYSRFKLLVDKCEPTVGATPLIMRVAADGVPNMISGASAYTGTGRRTNMSPADADWSSLAGSSWFLSQSQAVNGGNPGTFEIDIINSGPGYYGTVQWRSVYRRSDGIALEKIDASGYCPGTSDKWTHVRLVFNTGNIAAGMNYKFIGIN